MSIALAASTDGNRQKLRRVYTGMRGCCAREIGGLGLLWLLEKMHSGGVGYAQLSETPRVELPNGGATGGEESVLSRVIE